MFFKKRKSEEKPSAQTTRFKLENWSWVSVVDLLWKLKQATEVAGGAPFDYRTMELMYGPAVAEALIRTHGQTVAKLVPSGEDIAQAHARTNPSEHDRGYWHAMKPFEHHVEPIDRLSVKFAEISGDEFVAVSPRLGARAQLICHLAAGLEPIAREQFQTAFVWNEERRRNVFDETELATWDALELQLGMGIIASIWHAKDVVSDLTPKEFSVSLLRKYGIPVLVGEAEIYACHWCGTGPCSCGGGKAPARKVSYADAEQNLHRGPMDTQKGMYFPYAWANTARGGVGYGPFRALVEAATEKGAVLGKAETIEALERRFNRLLLPKQRHVAEVIAGFKIDKDARRKALLSELADAVHWQFLYGPGMLDHVSGLTKAIQYIAQGAAFELEMPK
jgi:hypothetical protein